jgi:pantoate--beta-alanine ligase
VEKFNSISGITSKIKSLKLQGKTISLVPTMGFLHQGHLSLIKKAKKESDIVIVSIFVNSKQFNDVNDFNNYPQNLISDIEELEKVCADILFYPTQEEVYPANNLININILQLADNLCGKYRSEHFQGVAIIITKLFNIIKPDVAIFGEKDFQQLQIIKKLVRDLSYDVKIISVPIFREKSGLALSSRNSRLSKKELITSANIYKILQNLRSKILKSQTNNSNEAVEESKKNLLKYVDKIDYLQVCQEDDLQIINNFNNNIKSRIFVAVYLGPVRLIDNIELY